jgi:hypothetical protein
MLVELRSEVDRTTTYPSLEKTCVRIMCCGICYSVISMMPRGKGAQLATGTCH